MRQHVSDSPMSHGRRDRWNTLFSNIYSSLRIHRSTQRVGTYQRQLPLIVSVRELGRQSAPIYRVVGTTGRFAELDQMVPNQSQMSEKSPEPLYDQQSSVIRLARIGETFYVIDGNRRVAQALERGQLFLSADVVELVVAEVVEDPVDGLALLHQYEREQLLIRTQLEYLRPDCQIDSLIPGNLMLLQEHLQQVQHSLAPHGSYTDAPAFWCNTLFQPIVQLIHQQRLLDDLSYYSELDLYLWAMVHRQPASSPTPTNELDYHNRRKYALQQLSLLASSQRRRISRAAD